jgi:hypothetical protein
VANTNATNDSPVTGTWNESGHANAQNVEQTTSTLNGDGTWTTAGAWDSSTDRGQNSAYAGAGTLIVAITPTPSSDSSDSSDSSGATITGGGTTTESGSDQSTYADSSHFTLGNDGTWQESSGNVSNSDANSTNTGYSGSGDYGYTVPGGGVQGIWNVSGGDNSNLTTQTVSALNPDGTWTTIGTLDGGGNGSQNISYGGSGNYVLPGTADGTIPSDNGTITESESDQGQYDYQSSFTLASDGSWQPVPGSNSSNSGDSVPSLSSGTGTAPAAAFGQRWGTACCGQSKRARRRQPHDDTNPFRDAGICHPPRRRATKVPHDNQCGGFSQQ